MSEEKILNSREAVAKVDKSNVLGSIEQLGDQVQHVWEIAEKIEIDSSYQDVNNIVVAGMGGSALGTDVIQSVFSDEIKLPITIVPHYEMPNFVNEKTLVIASSYSGNTEEAIAAAKDAIQKGAKVTGITSGGKLAELLKKHHLPALIFEPTYNPSNQPRMGLGYAIFGQIALFSKIGLLKISNKEYKAVLQTIANVHQSCGIDIPEESNSAKVLSYEFSQRIPIITVAEHLEGVAHVFANQLNENAKTYSEYRVVPEINHHLME
ncbi:unnamed protein product, partial [marine sediment metagenome]